MRDEPRELGLIEKLKFRSAERILISASGIEQKRSAPEKPFQLTLAAAAAKVPKRFAP
jgi:hypothetical protein